MGGAVIPSDPIRYAPKAWLDFACPPPPPRKAPWERPDPAPPPPGTLPAPLLEAGQLPVVERAKLYLAQVDPAVQGSGGHNAALWAARCLVVGFELAPEVAISLLWSHYNPRCVPPWNYESEVERKDLERKVGQAKETPPGKRPGWLLDEFGLRRTGYAADQARAVGETSASALLESSKKRAEVFVETKAAEAKVTREAVAVPRGERQPFPIGRFPEAVRDFCRRAAESLSVDQSFVALPALAVAGAAMGNAWRLKVKEDYEVPPILWVCLVGEPGSNKTGALKTVMRVLSRNLPVEQVGDVLLNPQGRCVVRDATLEAVVMRLEESPRGILNFRDELSGWIRGFGQHKKGGGADEQAWLEFWGGGEYSVDRKTNNQQTWIPAAAASVIGGIQPETLRELFTPARFQSGFVARVLIACPPDPPSFWSDLVVPRAVTNEWESAVTWLRATPFAGLDHVYVPRVVALEEGSPQRTAMKTAHDTFTLQMGDKKIDKNARGFLSKARGNVGRFALIHHGLRLACGSRDLAEPIAVESIEAGAACARWCVDEQLNTYGFGVELNRLSEANELLEKIRTKCPTKSATVRQVMRFSATKYANAAEAVAAMGQLVELGYAHWEDSTRDKIILNEVNQ